MGGDTRISDQAGAVFRHASDIGKGNVTLGPVTVRVRGCGLIFFLPTCSVPQSLVMLVSWLTGQFIRHFWVVLGGGATFQKSEDGTQPNG